ncbi:MAG: TSUP family transporter [Thermoanaerobaculales bacterium]
METVFASLPQFLLACLALAVAEAVYVLLGFGAGLIAVGALALVLPELKDVVVLLLLVNLPAELWVVRRSWREISWRRVLVLFVGVAVGIPLGTWFLHWGDPSFLLVVLGLFLVVVGAVFLLSPKARGSGLPSWIAPPTGLLSGLLTGLFGTGGPPLIVYFQLSGADKTAFRSNLMAVFLLMTTVRVPSYAAFGLITAPRLWSALAVMPAVLLGAFIGNHIHLRLAEGTFRRMVSAALVLIGLLLLIPAAG